MLLALGPLQLDPTVRTVVVGLVTEPAAACDEPPAAGADLIWLDGGPTPDQVADAGRRSGLPVGVTVDDLDRLADLVAAGAVAVEAPAGARVADVVAQSALVVWCTAAQARRAVEAGVPPERVVAEAGGAEAAGFAGATVPGAGPGAWGAIVRSILDGARIVRTTDVRAARRVATVADRLVASRAPGHDRSPS